MKEHIVKGEFEFRKLNLADAAIILPQIKEMHKRYSEKSDETLKSIEKDIRRSWIEMKNKKVYQYGIIFKNEFIGTITATPNFANKRCELGFYISPFYWGQGVFYKMIKTFISFLFKNGFNKVYFRTRSDNPRGSKALEKLNAKKEGTIRAYFYNRGKEIDAYYYGILKREFNN